MKQFLLIVSLLLTSVCYSFAADIIITRESGKIDAIIEEVSSTDIRYKKASNPKGPTFVISVNDVASIVYANGEVQAFENKQQQPAAVEQQPAANTGNYNSQYNNGGYNNGYNGGYQTQRGRQAYNRYQNRQNDPNFVPIVKISNSEYGYGNQILSRNQYINLISETCFDAFNQYRAGTMMIGSGWGSLAGGLTVALVSGWFFWPSFIIGGVFALASVPLLTVGYILRDKSVDTYNTICAGRSGYSMELKLKGGVGGFGLALSF